MLLAATLALAAPLQDRPVLPAPDMDDAVSPITARPRCKAESGDDAIVCGKADPMRFRMEPTVKRFEEAPLRPAFRLPGGGSGEVEAVQRTIAPGVSVPSAMLTLKIPLGRKREAEERE